MTFSIEMGFVVGPSWVFSSKQNAQCDLTNVSFLLPPLQNKMSAERAVTTSSFYGSKERSRPTRRGRRKYDLNQRTSTEMKLARGRWIVSAL